MDWTPNSSLEELLQPWNKMSRHIINWIYDLISGIHSASTNWHHADATPFATASI
jgi:hypothetical protein